MRCRRCSRRSPEPRARIRACSVGAETGPNGIDARYTAKITTTTTSSDQGVSSNLGFIVFPTNTSPVPIIRNEELILLRAQANHGLGNLAAASRDVNFVRVRSGNLAAKTHATLDDLLTDLLYNKRYSGLYETGMRWVDMRFYNRLDQLPKRSAHAPGPRELSGSVERMARARGTAQRVAHSKTASWLLLAGAGCCRRVKPSGGLSTREHPEGFHHCSNQFQLTAITQFQYLAATAASITAMNASDPSQSAISGPTCAQPRSAAARPPHDPRADCRSSRDPWQHQLSGVPL